MVGKIDTPGFHSYSHPSRVAYIPKLTKVGSTVSISLLREILNVTENDSLLTEYEHGPLNQYSFYCFIQHLMEQFLAGFHQIEIFLHMNWISGPINKLGLSWWNKFV
eukprot:5600675-Ditylum_brightwellii.AAC.1